MDWAGFWTGLGGFFEKVIKHGWWLVIFLAICALIWRQGWPWEKKT